MHVNLDRVKRNWSVIIKEVERSPSGCFQMTRFGEGLGEVELSQEEQMKLPKFGFRKSEVNLGRITLRLNDITYIN